MDRHHIGAHDPKLARVIAAWASLPAPLRAGIVAMVEAHRPVSDPPTEDR